MSSSISQSVYDCSLVVLDGYGNEFINGINIIDYGQLSDNRLLRIISVTFKLFFSLYSHKSDIYHLHDPELFFVGLLLRFKKRLVVFDFHEDIFTQIIKKRYLKYYTNYLCALLIKTLFIIYLRYFSFIVCATDYICNKYRRYNSNINSVENYPKNIFSFSDNLHPNQSNILENQSFTTYSGNSISLKNKLIVSYIGDISYDRGLLEMVQLSKISPKNIFFVFAGQCTCMKAKELLLKSHYEGSIYYLGVISRELVTNLLDITKVGLCLLKPVENYYNSKPTKIYEYMLHRVPFIASNFPEIIKIVNNHKCGIVVDPKNLDATSNALLNLLNNDEMCKKLGQNGHEAILDKYNWNSEFQKLLKTYKILKKSN